MCRILRCFHMSSGLKVNFSKSQFFGIGVSADDTNNFASFLNFQPSSLPCMYLGLPIGANMNRRMNWKPIIDKFHNRLSSWKAKTLSYGGRLTLIKSVLGALGTYYFSIFKAPKYVIDYMEKLRRNFFWEVMESVAVSASVIPRVRCSQVLGSALERIFKSRTKKKAKTKQNQARNGKDKVKGQPSEENIT
ncbi:hypothetical protein Tco_0291416 [Tanacetum coccineum]